MSSMSRKTRTLIANASYHIVSRGNQRQQVFFDDDDFQRFIDTLRKYKKKFRYKIYSYCLMPNHIHLLLDPVNKNMLKRIMHGVNMSYAKHFNYKYEKCGHLWQDRYQSFVIARDFYILNCVNYIEHNPARAKIVNRPEGYQWSSYQARALGKNDRITDFFEI